MKLVSNKKSKNVFLTSKSKFHNKSGTINLILSPQFYWVRKLEIPVKTSKQAKLILPTLFEDIVEQNPQELVYQVKKLEDNLYLCFAFNNNTIFEAIKNSGIVLSNIDSIYFAQIECEEIRSFNIDNQNFMYTQDDILVKLPDNLPLENQNLENKLQKISLSSFKVNIKLYSSSFLNNKNLNLVCVFFIILASINFIKYFSYKNEYNQIKKNLEKIKTQSDLPTSKIQTNVIINKYQSNINLENKKREIISYVISNNISKLESFKFENKTLSFIFIDKKGSQIENYINKKYRIFSSKTLGRNLIVSVKI